MESRMEKYYQSQESYGKRTDRNEELYKEVGKNEIEDFKINSNAKVLENNINKIDINELKSIIDRRYNETLPKRKSIFIDTPEEKKLDEDLPTKEYDINTILAKAREEKTSNYEEERLKKITNTQFDILKSLDLNEIKKEKPDDDSGEETLMTLINTITAKELESSKINPLDIFTDLKGSDNTEIIPAQKDLSTEDELTNTMSIDTSFYTTRSNFNKEDFEGFEEIQNETKSSKLVVGILITLAIIAFVIGAIIILNKYLNLGLF